MTGPIPPEGTKLGTLHWLEDNKGYFVAEWVIGSRWLRFGFRFPSTLKEADELGWVYIGPAVPPAPPQPVTEELVSESDAIAVGQHMFSHDPLNAGQVWDSLTLGEQWYYIREACKTAGAIYESKVSASVITFRIQLPPHLILSGLTERDAANYEASIHRCLEDIIGAILQDNAHRQRVAAKTRQEGK